MPRIQHRGRLARGHNRSENYPDIRRLWLYEPNSFYAEHRLIDKILVREYRKNTDALKNHPLFLQQSVDNVSTLLIVHGEDKSVPKETTDVYAAAFNAQVSIAAGFAHAFRDPANPQEDVPAYYDVLAMWLSE